MTTMKTMKTTRTHHISVVMNDEEREHLDEWMDRQTPRVRSRSEAIRQLIGRALKTERLDEKPSKG